jgi:hypothetical protein
MDPLDFTGADVPQGTIDDFIFLFDCHVRGIGNYSQETEYLTSSTSI